jgi:hypothetical protein
VFGEDVLEFVLRADASPSVGGGAGDGSSDDNNTGSSSNGSSGSVLVTYRSQAGQVKYLYPLTQPLPDGGLQRRRLDALR